MTPTRPYFLRAVFDWLLDNDCTPFLAVNAEYPDVDVPLEFVEDGQITLNISPSAVANFSMDNDFVLFSARFSGVSRDIAVPMRAVLGIFAKENGQGMAFPDEEFESLSEVEEDSVEQPSDSGVTLSTVSKIDTDSPDKPKPPGGGKSKPSLKVVK